MASTMSNGDACTVLAVLAVAFLAYMMIREMGASPSSTGATAEVYYASRSGGSSCPTGGCGATGATSYATDAITIEKPMEDEIPYAAAARKASMVRPSGGASARKVSLAGAITKLFRGVGSKSAKTATAAAGAVGSSTAAAAPNPPQEQPQTQTQSQTQSQQNSTGISADKYAGTQHSSAAGNHHFMQSDTLSQTLARNVGATTGYGTTLALMGSAVNPTTSNHEPGLIQTTMD